MIARLRRAWRAVADRVAPPLDPGDAPVRVREVEALAVRIAEEVRDLRRRLDALENPTGDDHA